MQTVPPFYVVPSIDRESVELVLMGRRGAIVARATFSREEARELQRQIGVALYRLRRRRPDESEETIPATGSGQ